MRYIYCIGCVRDGKLGGADTQLCSAKGMAEVAKLICERSGGTDFLGEDREIDEMYIFYKSSNKSNAQEKI